MEKQPSCGTGVQPHSPLLATGAAARPAIEQDPAGAGDAQGPADEGAGEALGPVQVRNKQQRAPEAADVVIIGGGIAGVSAAYHLRTLRPDLRVVLLEARQLSHGATGRNGGLLWPALNAPWAKTMQRYGKAEACKMMAFEQQCLREVTEFITGNGLEKTVRYSPFKDGSYHLYVDKDEMAVDLEELEMMQQEGFYKDCAVLDARQAAAALGTKSYCGAVQQPGVARVWGARLVHALAEAAAAAGNGDPERFVVVENAPVVSVGPIDPDYCYVSDSDPAASANNIVPAPMAREGATQGRQLQTLPEVPHGEPLDPCAMPLLEVRTADGSAITARRVLHCTNAYGSSLLPELRGALVPVRNQVAVTVVPPEGAKPLLPRDAAFYARRGYVYFSIRDDGRVLVGGFRDCVPGMEWNVSDDGSLDPRVSEQLRTYLPDVFGVASPLAADLEMEWSGILGFTQDRFPFVGPVPGRRGEFLAAGFSGHGMTRTFTCARAVAAMLVGERLDPAFPRSWLPSVGRFGPASPTVPGNEAAAGAVYASL